MVRDHVYKRIGLRYRWMLIVGSLLFFTALAVIVLFFLFGKPQQVKSIVIVGDPILVVSFFESRHEWIIVSIPSNVIVDALYGYGRYSLSSLWTLGAIDQKEGVLLASSLEDALAIPITWYIEDQKSGHVDPQTRVRRTLSLFNIGFFITRSMHTNIDIRSFLSLTIHLQKARSDSITVLDAAQGTILSRQELPDGTSHLVLLGERIDTLLGSRFENWEIRKERLSIGIYNTTTRPALGNHVARMLSRIGGLVVTVGNDDHPVDTCEVRGEKEAITSRTAAFIRSLLSCRIIASKGERTDLSVYIGTSYEKRYLPYQNGQKN